MPLSQEHVGSKVSAKIKNYNLTRGELLITLCNEITCNWVNFQFSIKKKLWDLVQENLVNIQGISYWNVFYELTLTDRNMQARFYLKVVLKFWGSDIWVSSTSFQKSKIGWPQQPQTEIGPKIQHDISWFYHFFFLSKHQNKAEFKNQYGSEVLSSDFPGLKTFAASMASTASTTSVASMNFTASFHQNNYCSW